MVVVKRQHLMLLRQEATDSTVTLLLQKQHVITNTLLNCFTDSL